MSKSVHVLELSKSQLCRQYLTISVRVKASRRFKLRTWAAIRLLKIAMRIMPGKNFVEVSL